ncbi:iron chelate uptake ABC transporter family permease subunit [Haemophilus pittmaniae]|uniref:iron chelate uptake ABC transporter family permease subunit n=1 Tax=Haemophilus pittmaniae TaxID=249188 RepID=UPI0028DC065A|nr:iron chelate uptake ABC transporter family permease subunit [Haemophilus pittmaniae]
MNKSSLTFPLLLCLLIGLILCSLTWGRFAIPLENVVQSLIGNNINDVQNNIIFNLRLPRTLAAILVGASLAIAGVVYQGIFRNPLVSPDILGVSNGACVGAALAILIGSGMLGIQAFAFVGGLIAVLLTMNLPRLIQRDSTIVLVLSGIIVSGFMMAALDYGNVFKTLSLIKELSLQGFTIVMTTHNPDHPMLLHSALPHSRVSILNEHGKLQTGSAPEIITEANLKALYQTDLRLVDVPALQRQICAITHL